MGRDPTRLATEAVENQTLRPLLTGAGTRVTSAVALLQLSAPRPAWGGYAGAGIDEGFARTNKIRLENRTSSYPTDRDAWLAVARDPSLAIVDSGVLPRPELRGRTPGLGMIGFVLNGLPGGPGTMLAQDIWVANPLGVGGAVGAKRMTVIGVIDRRASSNFRGVHISMDTLRSLGQPFRPALARYYFTLAPGAAVGDARAALGEAFFADGLQTIDLDETFRNQTGPVLLGSGLLQLFVGLGLISGVAALAVVATRSTLERRQQIGMLRAVGATRHQVTISLLLEDGGRLPRQRFRDRCGPLAVQECLCGAIFRPLQSRKHPDGDPMVATLGNPSPRLGLCAAGHPRAGVAGCIGASSRRHQGRVARTDPPERPTV